MFVLSALEADRQRAHERGGVTADELPECFLRPSVNDVRRAVVFVVVIRSLALLLGLLLSPLICCLIWRLNASCFGYHRR